MTNIKEAISLIKTANNILETMESGDNYDRIDSVSWRLADALGLLKQFESCKHAQGINTPTRRGFIINKIGGEPS